MVRKIVNRTDEIVRGDPRHREDLKRQTRFLIIVTLAFTIAFSWRQTIFDAFLVIAGFITGVSSPTTLSIMASILITILSLIIIYITSRLMPDNAIYS